MGVIGNSHGGFYPADKAKAEHIAATRIRSLSQIIHALAGLDEAGHYFWSGDREAARNTTEVTFSLLKSARDELDGLVSCEAEFAEIEDESPKLRKAQELGIHWPSSEFRTRNLAGDRRIIAMIDHLLLSEEAALDGLDSNDLKPSYVAVSSPGRTLAEHVCHHLLDVLSNSRLTHEMSDVVYGELVKEGSVQPEFEFSGPAQP